MNTYELQQAHDYYTLHPCRVECVIPSTGNSAYGLFNRSYVAGGFDRAGVLIKKLMKHFVTSISYRSYFENLSGVTVTIDSVSYKISNVEVLDEMGAVQIWLT